MKKIKAGEQVITVGKPSYIFSKYEEEIKCGDVIGYALKPKIINHSPQSINNGSSVMLTTEIHQPILSTGILLSIIDATRIYVIDKNGKTNILDREYFPDIVLLHKKDTNEALGYYTTVYENIGNNGTISETIYAIDLLGNVSKKFKKEYLTTMEN